jgi:type I restriction enzyme S subunit
VRDITDDVINFEKCKRIDQKSFDDLAKNGCQPLFGDLLFSKDGTVGKVCLVNHDKMFVVLSSLAIIRPDPKTILPEYLFHILKSSDFLEKALGKKSGTAIRRIILRDLKNIKFNIHESLEEQRRVVERLDAAFEKIDRAIDLTRANTEKSKKVLKSYITNTFTKLADMSPVKLIDVYDVRDGTHDSPRYVASGYPLVTSKNLKTGVLNLEKIQYINKEDFMKINERSKVDIGDILMAMIGTIGNAIIVENKPNFAIKNVALFKPRKSQNGSFLKYYLSSEFVINKMLSEAKGATQKFVSLGYLRSFPFVDVNIELQNKIVHELDAISYKTKTLENMYIAKINLFEKMKHSLLQQAFSGDGVQ